MVRLVDGPLATAQSLAGMGFNVLPAKFKDKAPIVPWTKYQNTRTDHLLPSWFGGSGARNYWGMTGRMSGVIVIDCDNEAGLEWWESRIGSEVLATAARVKTRKGHHYYFKIPADWPAEQTISSWSVHDSKDPDSTSFDVRADGTGVILPPSVHESGHVYKWEKPLTEAAYAPPELLDGTYRKQAPVTPGGPGATATRTAVSGVTRSMLSALLQNPPGGEGSGRNDWLARVAGHYAKTYHNTHDLYLTHCQAANSMMSEPLDDKEFEKTVDSVWKGEHERNPQRALDADCGWLQDGGWVIMTQVVHKSQDDNRSYELAPYSNFNMRAKGVMVNDDGQRTYWVELLVKRPNGTTEVRDTVLPAKTSGDERALKSWLASFGVSVLSPANLFPKEGSPGLRLQRYLESQNPPQVKITAALGWDEEILGGAGGFVTHDGVITATETLTTEQSGVRANPVLLSGGVAPHQYGFENDGIEAKRVLREVMSFHEDRLTSVFGAWWAACLVKPQLEDNSSLFPFVAIEAPSESGKTNGYFDMMVQLNGNTRGESQSTKAALRDMAAAHRNGIVWIDDMDDPANLMELLRAATSGGTITKMGEDRTSVKNAKIVAPIVISGEQLGMNSQKALLDRAITIHATSPTHRMSLHDPTRPQWDDVLTVREQYPHGLSEVAGWLVQDALSVVDQVLACLKQGRRGVTGRAGDKIAILRAGARLLDYLMARNDEEIESAWSGTGHVAGQVESWVEGEAGTDYHAQDNALTLTIIPWALRHFDYPDAAYAKPHPDATHTPVFIRNPNGMFRTVQQILGEPVTGDGGPEIWYSVPLLAEAWERHKHGRVDKRTESADALKGQADALKMTLGGSAGRQVKIKNGNGAKSFYRVIRGDMVRRLVARAEGSE